MGRPTAAVLLVAAVLFARAAQADDFAHQVDQLTGADTSQTRAMDSDLAQLLSHYDALMAQFEATTDSSKSSYLDQAKKVLDQASTQARNLADLRAQAAVEQKCPVTSGGGATGDSGTSPYLPDVVRSAVPGDQPNDPWAVCVAARQYVLGVMQEIAALRQRAQAFVGQDRDISEYPVASPVTEVVAIIATPPGIIATAFNPPAPLEIENFASNPFGGIFSLYTQQAQRVLAAARVEDHVEGLEGTATDPFRTPDARIGAMLQPAKRRAYYDVQQAAALLWFLSQKEASFRLAVAEATLVRRQSDAASKFAAEVTQIREAFEAEWPEQQWQEHDEEFKNSIASLCSRANAAERPVFDEAVNQARAIARVLFETRRRLIADLNAWKTFGLKDGAGTTSESGTFNYQDEDFGKFIAETMRLNERALEHHWEAGLRFFVPASHGAGPFVPGDRPSCVEFGYFLDDPTVIYPQSTDQAAWDSFNARVLAAVQQHYPEAVSAGGDSGLWLTFTEAGKNQEEEEDVSGAGIGQSP